MTKRRTRQSSKRGSKTSLVLAAIVGVVLVIQYGLGINLLGNQEENGSNNTPVATTAPVATQPPAATSATGGTPIASGGAVAIPGGIDGGWYQLYFTSPINTTDESRFTGAPLENALVRAIDSAQRTIDMAVFEFNSQPVTDALVRAKNRGVQIRVVTDGEHGLESPEGTLDQLTGITIVSDGTRGAFMHDKFFVFDGQYVWTGSTNITKNDIYNNNNSSILIRSSQLAQNYTDEFNELFAKQFGITSPTTLTNPAINQNGTQIETVFESEGNLPARIVQFINSSSSIRFMAFSLTRDDMMNAMLARFQAGADVMGIVEASGRRFSKPLFCGGVDIKQDGNPDVLHHKIFIFNGQTVVIGSFNFSDSAANQNDENTLIITNPDIAQAYLQEFERRWAEADTVPLSNFGC